MPPNRSRTNKHAYDLMGLLDKPDQLLAVLIMAIREITEDVNGLYNDVEEMKIRLSQIHTLAEKAHNSIQSNNIDKSRVKNDIEELQKRITDFHDFRTKYEAEKSQSSSIVSSIAKILGIFGGIAALIYTMIRIWSFISNQ